MIHRRPRGARVRGHWQAAAYAIRVARNCGALTALPALMNRRLFLSLAAGLATAPLRARALTRPPALRRLRLVNPHTGENFEGTYRDDKGPIERVMEELCVFFRDHHSGEKTQMDIGVIDFMADVMAAVGETGATVLSAYRT